MNNTLKVLLLCFFIVLLIVGSARQEEQPDGITKEGSSAIKKKITNPSQILIRKVEMTNLALDGAIFMDIISKETRIAKPEILKMLSLISSNKIKFDSEKQIVLADKKEKSWEKNPTDYDFFIKCTSYLDEWTKRSFSEPPRIDVKEVWQIEKTSGLLTKKSWAIKYLVVGTTSVETEEREKQVAKKQVEEIIAPLRGQVLKGIYQFIDTYYGVSRQESSDANHIPEIDPKYSIKDDNEYDDDYRKIKSALKRIEIQASDKNGDQLDYEWTATSGLIKGEGNKASWEREIIDGKVVEGRIIVVVTDGKGGKNIREFIFTR